MQAKFEKIRYIAICTGCAFVEDITGDLMCKKYTNNGFMQHIEDIGPETCDKLKQTINQLKLTHVKVGLGFLIEPCKDDPGDASVILLGSTGIIFKSKLSEMFPNEKFAVFLSYRIFNEGGQDQTKIIREKILNKAFENSPKSITDPYASLLDPDTSAPAQVAVTPDEEGTYKPMDPDAFTKALRSRATAVRGEEDDGTLDLGTLLYRARPSHLGRSGDWSIAFDFENFTCTSGEFKDDGGKLIGVQQLSNLTFLGCLAGGDWEVPVFFIAYFDSDGLPRVYVPKKGNVFCEKHKCAYGSCVDHVASPENACPAEPHELDKYDWSVLQTDIEETFGLDLEVPEEV